MPTSAYPQFPEHLKGERERLFSFLRMKTCVLLYSICPLHINTHATWILAWSSQHSMDTWCTVQTHIEHLWCWESKRWLHVIRYRLKIWKTWTDLWRCVKCERWSSTDICNPCTVWYKQYKQCTMSIPSCFFALKSHNHNECSCLMHRQQALGTWSSLYYYYLYALYRATCMQGEAQLFNNCTHLFSVSMTVHLCLLGMPGSEMSIRCEWWIESEGLPEASRDTIPVRAHRDSSSSAQSILEARPQTIWGRDAQTQHF